MRYLILVFLVIGLYANDDLKLLKLALNNGLKPVPNNYEALLKILDTDSKELSIDKIKLGEKLFFEKDLSLGKDISCASCHSFDKGGADGIATAIGHKNRTNPFHLNTPTVFNTAFSQNLFWNGRSKSLEDQAKGPMQAPFEMSITPKLAEQRVKANENYVKEFEKIYGKNSITFENIANAIAAYEKTIITRGRYDEFLLGNFDALNKYEKEGLSLFITKSCVGCHNGMALGGQTLRKFPLVYHTIWSKVKPLKIKILQKRYLDLIGSREYKNSIDKENYLISKLGKYDFELIKEGYFHQIAEDKRVDSLTSTSCTQCHQEDIYKIKKEKFSKIAYPFENKGGFVGSEDKNLFRVPLLRNIVRTKPYFHNGSIERLETAIKIMGTHQSRSELRDEEIDKIVSFLKAVDGEVISYDKL